MYTKRKLKSKNIYNTANITLSGLAAKPFLFCNPKYSDFARMYGIKFDETSMVNIVNSSMSLSVKEIPTTLQIINSPILSMRESRIPPLSLTKSNSRA